MFYAGPTTDSQIPLEQLECCGRPHLITEAPCTILVQGLLLWAIVLWEKRKIAQLGWQIDLRRMIKKQVVSSDADREPGKAVIGEVDDGAVCAGSTLTHIIRGPI